MLTEPQLIAGLKKGQMNAYEQAFHTYYPVYVHFAEYIVGDLQVAKDLVQNVFLKIWRYRDRLDETLSFRNFMYVLTKREVLNYLRSKRVYESLEAILDVPSTAAQAEHISDASFLRLQVNKLPEQRRNVFIMSRFYGLSNKEIAKQLCISEKTVERHITLAGKQLREELENRNK
jgi:RNA polymerase sigma-70 factor (ECF subfamily)